MTLLQSSITNTHADKLKGLYAITDEQLMTEQCFAQKAEAALQGGVKIIQYRDKSDDAKKRFQQASLLSSLCKQYQAICIINDDIELAKSVNAHGVHLGKDDASISNARQLLGENAIIGISCYNNIELAITAEKNAASYVAFGAMFSSPTKPDAIGAGPEIISTAKQQLATPVCAIGGITDKNIKQLIQQGTDMAAVISGLFAADDIKSTANLLSRHFN